MRWMPLLLVVPLLTAAPLPAAERPARPAVQRDGTGAADTIRAATSRAVASLMDQISQQPITGQVTVGQLLSTLESTEAFKGEFLRQRADQIGGPRWVDEYTCQVQLEISSARIGRELMRYAASHTRSSPVTAEQIDLAVNRWSRRVFSATGSSAAAVALSDFKPVTGVKWAAVSATARQKALADASSDAARRAMDSVGSVVLSNQKTLGDSFAVPEVNAAVRGWLSRRPVTRVDFREDLQVEVALSVDGADFFNVVRAALDRQRTITLSKDLEWAKVERDFSSRVISPVGFGRVADEKVNKSPAVGPSVVAVAPAPQRPLPTMAPEWVGQVLEIKGSAMGLGSKLKTSLAAEADARTKLQTRLEGLVLDRGFTMAQAAKGDRRVAEELLRTVKQARISKIEYRPDGSVSVQMICDLREFWDDIRR